MTQKDIFLKWLDISKKDFEMARIAFKHRKYAYTAFHLQQSVEKSLKGLIIKIKKEQPPYIHDLTTLASLLSKDFPVLENYMKLFSGLNPFYIEARYPSYIEKISKSLDKSLITHYLKQTGEFHLWLEKKVK